MCKEKYVVNTAGIKYSTRLGRDEDRKNGGAQMQNPWRILNRRTTWDSSIKGQWLCREKTARVEGKRQVRELLQKMRREVTGSGLNWAVATGVVKSRGILDEVFKLSQWGLLLGAVGEGR